jgi:Na+-transporting NADH:ubiquinone oxidoreductase subunit D
MTVRSTLLDPVLERNPVLLQVLGVCSALAITNSLHTSLIMGASLTAVATFSNGIISALRHIIPSSLRIIIQMTVIATGVVVVEQVLQAFAPDTARTLSVFIGLIVTNCIVLGRAEAFAAKNSVGMSILDGLGNGLGYTAVLVVVGAIRELFGAGTLLGIRILTLSEDGGSFDPNQLMLLPPSAFFIIGFIIWALRSWKRDQIEEPEFHEIKVHSEQEAEPDGRQVP